MQVGTRRCHRSQAHVAHHTRILLQMTPLRQTIRGRHLVCWGRRTNEEGWMTKCCHQHTKIDPGEVMQLLQCAMMFERRQSEVSYWSRSSLWPQCGARYNMQFCCRCTTPAEQTPQVSAPEASNLRIALQDFRLNPCTSRDGPPNSTEVATSKPPEPDGKPACNKARGQKAIADFFKRSSSVPHGEAGARHDELPAAEHRMSGRHTSELSGIARVTHLAKLLSTMVPCVPHPAQTTWASATCTG